jgi:hypothetical protein
MDEEMNSLDDVTIVATERRFRHDPEYPGLRVAGDPNRGPAQIAGLGGVQEIGNGREDL